MLALLGNKGFIYVIVAVAVSIMIAGAYVKGRSEGRALEIAKAYEQQIQWEAKVATLQTQQHAEVAQIAEKYKKQDKLFREEIDRLKKNSDVSRLYIPIEVDTFVPSGFISLHNTAAKGQVLGQTPQTNTMSTKTISDVGNTIAVNYNICNDARAQLTALQEVVKSFQQKQRELNQ